MIVKLDLLFKQHSTDKDLQQFQLILKGKIKGVSNSGVISETMLTEALFQIEQEINTTKVRAHISTM